MRWMLGVVCAGVTLSAATSAAQLQTGEEHGSRYDLQTYYPSFAHEAGAGGIVQLSCTVLPHDNRLGECTVVSASPQGWGFEDATIALAETELQAGRDVRLGAPGEQVLVSVRWAPEGAPVLPDEVWSGAIGRILELTFGQETQLLGGKYGMDAYDAKPRPLGDDWGVSDIFVAPGAKTPGYFR